MRDIITADANSKLESHDEIACANNLVQIPKQNTSSCSKQLSETQRWSNDPCVKTCVPNNFNDIAFLKVSWHNDWRGSHMLQLLSHKFFFKKPNWKKAEENTILKKYQYIYVDICVQITWHAVYKIKLQIISCHLIMSWLKFEFNQSIKIF